MGIAGNEQQQRLRRSFLIMAAKENFEKLLRMTPIQQKKDEKQEKENTTASSKNVHKHMKKYAHV